MAGVTTYHELDVMLTKMSDKSNTAELWIDCFVCPTLDNQTGHFICGQWVRCFHIIFRCFISCETCQILYYLRSMKSIPEYVHSLFMQGRRHVSGASNSTWSDMFIESTSMRYGHSQGGLTGINLNDNAMERLALTLHLCSKLIHDLTLMRDDLLDNPTHPKVESKAHMHSDSSDRQIYRQIHHNVLTH